MLPRRLAFVFVAISTVVAASACGGDKARPSEEGQPDYLSRVAELSTQLYSASHAANCGKLDLAGTCDRSALEKALKQFANDWDDLSPPAGLAAAHREYAASALKLIPISAIPTEEIREAIKKDPSIVSAALTYQDNAKAWKEGLESHYHVKLFTAEGLSMAPALCDGDTLFFEPLDGTVARWQLVVFQFPLDTSRHFLKRVVGLPGETIEVRDGDVYVNGAVIEGDTYAKDKPNYTYGPRTVPPDQYFVLGDNRRNSFDSHAWGSSCAPQQNCDFLPANLILGVLPADTKGCKASSG